MAVQAGAVARAGVGAATRQRFYAGRSRHFWAWAGWFASLIAFAGVALGGVRLRWLPQRSIQEAVFVYGAGAAVLLIIWYFISLLRRTPTLKGIFEGEDRLASTSKFQFFVWTAALLYAYTSLYASRAAPQSVSLTINP